MSLYWGLRVDLMECRRDKIHFYGVPGRGRGADRELGLTIDVATL